MHTHPLTGLLAGLFDHAPGGARVAPKGTTPQTIPDPDTGQPLQVAAVEVSDRGVCPACTTHGVGSYVSFVADMRLAFACRSCQQLVWLAGA
jgi:hypothetical protein